jgi:E3 ubiquitin-protein ligase HUWE1
MAVYRKEYLPASFSRAFYKQILGQPVDMEDLNSFDPEFYRSMQWMLQNDITGTLDHLTFSHESYEFGEMCVVDLKDDGRNIPVTNDNKQEYVKLMCAHKLTGSVQAQIDAFKNGFNDVIPLQYIRGFDDRELEQLIAGLPEIDVAKMKANTLYDSPYGDSYGYTAHDKQIEWFWKTLEKDFTKEEIGWFVQFVTGTSRIPLEGLNLEIHRSIGQDRLPESHTCFNELHLPNYDDEETLKQKLKQAVREAHEGFGLR